MNILRWRWPHTTQNRSADKDHGFNMGYIAVSKKKPALGEAGKQYWKQCEQCRTEQVGYKLNHSVLIKIIVIIKGCNPDVYVSLFTTLKGDGHHKLHFPDDVLFFLTANKPLTLRHK
ncbi:hypothetical protein LEC33_08270 [Salmonella enterica]|nr:hypothetical protein [Salmonella enterica]MDJ7045888.1 hypothetical protein [Salmonella enterica]MDJ7335592.1 hypothetical protein [Salmonella enterica]